VSQLKRRSKEERFEARYAVMNVKPAENTERRRLARPEFPKTRGFPSAELRSSAGVCASDALDSANITATPKRF
jgi:hypothetical protein